MHVEEENLPEESGSASYVTLNDEGESDIESRECNDDSESETSEETDEGSSTDGRLDEGGSDFSDNDNAENLYVGSSIKNASFDALLLALSQKHQLSDAALNDFLKLFKLALPEENNVASSSYTFHKRNEQCTLEYSHVRVCPECLEKVLETDLVCRNNSCDMVGEKVDPIGFFTLPLKPQIQRLIEGTVIFCLPHMGGRWDKKNCI